MIEYIFSRKHRYYSYGYRHPDYQVQLSLSHSMNVSDSSINCKVQPIKIIKMWLHHKEMSPIADINIEKYIDNILK